MVMANLNGNDLGGEKSREKKKRKKEKEKEKGRGEDSWEEIRRKKGRESDRR